MSDKFKQYDNLDSEQLSVALSNASFYGELEDVQYLLINTNADIHSANDVAFRNACRFGHLNIIKYLLTSSELKEHANTGAYGIDNITGFGLACLNGKTEVVKYLLTSPDLNKHVDVHEMKDKPFELACSKKQFDTLRYLIFDYQIEYTQDIQDIIAENILSQDKKYAEIFQKVENMFEMRALNQSLEKGLSSGKDLQRKNKI